MKTYIAYFDETGDDGANTKSSDSFVLTSLYMSSESWQSNFDKIRSCRRALKEQYGFHIDEELHTKQLLTDKHPYRDYGWSAEQKRGLIATFTKCISRLDAKIINVIIDKTKFRNNQYLVLQNALKYNIQRIENDSNGEWNYLVITDEGRIAPMRKTGRMIRTYNPIQSQYGYDYTNHPIKGMIEDILEKNSRDSYFIQACDFVSYMVHLYYKTSYLEDDLPNRVANVIDSEFPEKVLDALERNNILNLKASNNEYGLVIYPRT